MKKFVSAFLMAVLLCCCTAAAAFAAGPATPVINGQMPDCYMNLGGTGVTLFTDASVSDGGTLRYQWYVSDVEDISTIRAIDGAEGAGDPGCEVVLLCSVERIRRLEKQTCLQPADPGGIL